MGLVFALLMVYHPNTQLAELQTLRGVAAYLVVFFIV
jgi:hypothetical protein